MMETPIFKDLVFNCGIARFGRLVGNKEIIFADHISKNLGKHPFCKCV